MTPKNTGHGSRNAPHNPAFREARERGGAFTLTKREARAYQRAARATGRRRRIQQLTRLLRRTP